MENYHYTKAVQLVRSLKTAKFSSPKELMQRVAKEKGETTLEELIGPGRGPESISLYRQAMQYLLNYHFRLTLQEIAQLTGRKNHATVIHAIKKIREYVK